MKNEVTPMVQCVMQAEDSWNRLIDRYIVMESDEFKKKFAINWKEKYLSERFGKLRELLQENEVSLERQGMFELYLTEVVSYIEGLLDGDVATELDEVFNILIDTPLNLTSFVKEAA